MEEPSPTNALSEADLALVEFLSLPEERLSWQRDGLPSEELYLENAILLAPRLGRRYPLLIDPTGQAVRFQHNSGYDKRPLIQFSVPHRLLMATNEATSYWR